MKKFMMVVFACMLAVSLLAVAADKEAGMGKAKTVTGWVVDEKCGAAGAVAGKEECTKKCIEAGSKVVFVGDKDKKVWQVQNPETLKGHEGHHVQLSAHVDTAANSVHIMEVKMLGGETEKMKK